AVPLRAPWELVGKAILDPASAYKFELYDVRHDWTQYTDVAAANPGKVREMTDLMFGEFAKYQVLPLDASVASRLVAPRPNAAAGASPPPGAGGSVSRRAAPRQPSSPGPIPPPPISTFRRVVRRV